MKHTHHLISFFEKDNAITPLTYTVIVTQTVQPHNT